MITKLTHHNMGAFFSATDMDEITGNAEHYNYYISLVVDFKGDYKCKIAIPTKVETTSNYEMRDRDGKLKRFSVAESKDVVIVGDLSVKIESNISVDQWFMDRIAELKKSAAEAAKAKVSKLPAKVTYDKSTSTSYGTLWDDKLDLFIANVLSLKGYTAEDFKKSNITLYKIMKDIDSLSEDEFLGWIESIEPNIGIEHFNVYGRDEVCNETKHIKSMISSLKNYSYISTSMRKRIDIIIETLEEYIKYENQYAE